MQAVPVIPESAPFTSEQRSWLNGFLAGMLSRGAAPQTAALTAPAAEKKGVLIAYGSQSGNAESLAKKLAKQATARGFTARAAGLESLEPAQLAPEKNVLIITSTWGEGDMPDNAVDFWAKLNQNGSSPPLNGVAFSVLALGDKNYGDTFCLAGRRLDERLAELGAQRIHPRVECDVDFDEPAEAWSAEVFKALENPGSSASALVLAEAKVEVVTEAEETTLWSKKNPYPAKLLGSLKLNADGSVKDTRHVSFCLKDSGLIYETGDALGVFVQNCGEVVDSVMAAHGLDPAAAVKIHDGGEMPLRDALIRHYEVRALLHTVPAEPVTAQALIESLRKLQPRLYSIASSQRAHPEEVHLCVGAVRYEADGLPHKGVASTFLAERLAHGETAGVFVHTAKHFRVPTDGRTPVIMVGPGTGIAPFRAFLQERHAAGAEGPNWLFFGDQRSATDYLYREEIEAWVQSGFLTKLSLAFSRDQTEKIYVQTRMMEHAAELWRWLEQGAHFYVCGDASRMAKDVDAALHAVIAQEGGRSADEAAAYVAELKKSKRYARDVY